MVKDEKKAYLEQIRDRYRKSRKKLKAKILDEFCINCQYHRKHAIRLLAAPFRCSKPKMRPRGSKSIYNTSHVLEPLTSIWLLTNQMCSKKLKAALPLWLPHYNKPLTEEITSKLLSMSPATIDRLLAPCRVKYKRKGLSGTRPGTLLKNQIPIKTGNWDVNQPGFCEADTVAHCGNSLLGDFAWSLTLTDIYSTWTENRATWGKGSAGVITQIEDIEKNLPFSLLGFDCDNGAEFLNYHLLNYFSDRPSGKRVQFTRSRAYHKNDNAHVEQKNWTHVRQLLGYDRFDNIALVSLMNNLYRNEYSLLQNYFYPTMKLISKERINSKCRKKYDAPATPYQRLLKSDYLPAEQKDKLTKTFMQLNPVELKCTVEKKLKIIFGFLHRSYSMYKECSRIKT